MFVLFSHANPKSKGGAKRRLYFLGFELRREAPQLERKVL
jgi:hypothetical protein